MLHKLKLIALSALSFISCQMMGKSLEIVFPNYHAGQHKDLKLTLVQGDFTKQRDANVFVNQANPNLLNTKSGICGAIFKAAGEEDLARACKAFPNQPPLGWKCYYGQTVTSLGFGLGKNSHIIHAVPVDLRNNKANLNWHERLSATYEAIIDAANRLGFRHNKEIILVIPALGSDNYPIFEATTIAIHRLVRDIIGAKIFPHIKEIRIVLDTDELFDIYYTALYRNKNFTDYILALQQQTLDLIPVQAPERRIRFDQAHPNMPDSLLPSAVTAPQAPAHQAAATSAPAQPKTQIKRTVKSSTQSVSQPQTQQPEVKKYGWLKTLGKCVWASTILALGVYIFWPNS